MIRSAFAFALAWGLGLGVVSAAWARPRGGRAELAVMLSLSLGVGLGVSALIFAAVSVLARRPAETSAMIELAGAAALWGRGAAPAARAVSFWRVRGGRDPAPSPWPARLLAFAGAQAAVLAAIAAVRAWRREPWGSWDGWAIWNLHARLMFRGGPGWPGLLRDPALGWSHLDYPWLVPGAVARAWAFAGHESPALAGAVSGAFGLATAALLVSALAALRTRAAGWLGGLVLLGTPFFVAFSTNEHADIPLGFFILASLALLALREREPAGARAGLSAHAGLCAGLAAWTKNEGVLFAGVVLVVWAVPDLIRGRWRSGLPLALVLAGFLGARAAFGHLWAPAGDLMSGAGHRLGQLVAWERYRVIGAAVARDLAAFGQWWVAPWALLGLALIGPRWKRWRPGDPQVALTLAVVAAGYWAVYLLTPWNLQWQLDTSLVRLLLQLWPGVLLAWGCALPQFDWPAASRRPAAAGAGFILANLAAAAVIVLVCAHQSAPGELAQAGLVRPTVRVFSGDGWFPAERNARDHWQWSRGHSTLIVWSRRPATVRLSFALRSLDRRTVDLTAGGRPVWRGQVGTSLEKVELAPVQADAGATIIRLDSREPGVPESRFPDARTLTFAVYDLRVKL